MASAEPAATILALLRAYQACAKAKRLRPDVQAFAHSLPSHLFALAEAIASGSYRPGRSFAFVCRQPKLREIHASPFLDRVMQHWVVAQWQRLLEPKFYCHSVANRVGKGTLAGVKALRRCLRRPDARFTLKLDIANFFHSIDKAQLQRRLWDELNADAAQTLPPLARRKLAQVTHALLADEPATSAQRLGSQRLAQAVPAHKRLGAAGPGIGLAIGNLSSQFFANVVLDRLDQFVKHQLKIPGYVRYVDDFVLVAESAERLVAARVAIAQFVQAQLGLHLKALPAPQAASNGVDFLGYVVRARYLLVRRRVLARLTAELKAFGLRYQLRHAGSSWAIAPVALTWLWQRLASALGHFQHASCGQLWQRLVAGFSWLGALFVAPQNALNGGLVPRWQAAKPSAARRLRQQMQALLARAGTQELLVQVGNRYRIAQCRSGQIASRAELDAKAARRQCAAWRAAGRSFARAIQHGWQRDQRAARVITQIYRPPLPNPGGSPCSALP